MLNRSSDTSRAERVMRMRTNPAQHVHIFVEGAACECGADFDETLTTNEPMILELCADEPTT